ncbi:MAG: Dot/Icm T4SS effector Wip [Gammaproteobacteria bacterium]
MNIIINDPLANIDLYPRLDKSHPADSKNQLTIGDLHGNALKLIYFLVRQNIIILDPKVYPELVRIYKLPTESITKADLDSFDNIIATITAQPVGSVRLIGDELCDRGNNDYFTLKILERIGELKIPVEILVSNHSNDFMDQYETQDDFIPLRLNPSISLSMVSLQILINKGLVSRTTIDTIVTKHILPFVKALSYTLDKDNNKITIYSHAGIDLSVIASFAKTLDVTYCDDSAEHLGQTIDLINAKIALHLRNNTLHTLYNHEALMHYDAETLKTHFPFIFILWNRDHKILQRPIEHAKGYKLDFVHGHDSVDKTHLNIFNLDNSLGKCESLHQDDYSILYSQELPSYQCSLLTKQIEKLEHKEDQSISTAELSKKAKKTSTDMDIFASHAKSLFSEFKQKEQQHKRALVLNMLDKAKLLTPTYIELLTQLSSQQIDKLTFGIKHLIECNLAKSENMDCLFQAKDHYDKVAKALAVMEITQNCTPYTRNLIAKYPDSACDITLAMSLLNSVKILSEENLIAIEKSLQQSPPAKPDQCAKLLCQLHKLNLLNSETRNLAAINAIHHSHIQDAINELVDKAILSPELCIAVLKHGKVANSIKFIFLTLHRYTMLPPEIHNTLIANAEHAESLAIALQDLQMNSLLNFENGKIMLENSAHAIVLSRALIVLDDANLSEHFPHVLLHPAYSLHLANAIKHLYENRLLDQETYNIIFTYPQHSSALAFGLSKLWCEKNYTDENRMLLMYYAHEIKVERRDFFYFILPSLLNRLKSAQFLNSKNIELLKQLNAQQVENLSHLLFRLDRYRIFSEANFQAFIAIQVKVDGRILQELLDRLEKVELVSHAKLKRSQTTLDKLLACGPFLEELNHDLKVIKPLTTEIFEKLIKEKQEKLKLINKIKNPTQMSALSLFSTPQTRVQIEPSVQDLKLA